jgi:hypothetical protein
MPKILGAIIENSVTLVTSAQDLRTPGLHNMTLSNRLFTEMKENKTK